MTIHSTDADELLTLLTQYRELRDQMFSTGDVAPEGLAEFAGEDAPGIVREQLLPFCHFDRCWKFDLYLLDILEKKMGKLGFRYYDLVNVTFPEVVPDAV